MKTVYIETSIVSFLRSRPSGHVISAARQLITRRWWEEERQNYQLVSSQFVLDEAAQGDPILAAERIALLSDIPVVEISDEIPTLADQLLSSTLLPPNARLDALHICAASFHRLDYLLTWNCTHIANARLLPRIRQMLADLGYKLPEVCTPEELLDDQYPIT